MLETAFSSPAADRAQKGVQHSAKLSPLTLVVSEAEFDGWLKSAPVGGLCVYAVGVALPHKNAVCVKVGELARAGRLALTQRPCTQGKGPRKFEYCARRLADPAPGEARAPRKAKRRDAGSLEGTIEGMILAQVVRAANFGKPCPSHAELALALDLPSREIARYRFQRLIDLGYLELLGTRANQRRVVRIIGTGKTTQKGAI